MTEPIRRTIRPRVRESRPDGNVYYRDCFPGMRPLDPPRSASRLGVWLAEHGSELLGYVLWMLLCALIGFTFGMSV